MQCNLFFVDKIHLRTSKKSCQTKFWQYTMATLSLKISVAEKNVIKTIQFEPSMMVYDACRIIREKILEANLGQGNLLVGTNV